MYSHSTKAQLINPRKVYAIDPGKIDAVSAMLTEDHGRKLENLIFLHLRRTYKELYYFDEKGECDFVAIKNGAIALVQVCFELTTDNLNRELSGLIKAMKFFNVSRASIVTFNDTDYIEESGFRVDVLPAYKFLL